MIISIDLGQLGWTDLDVEYVYIAPSDGGFDEPATSEEWIIESVCKNGVEILYALTDKDFDVIIELIKEGE
jgi:basic membrane lipoprotein Med (substrate-binding protein (PBP1-ABC) superfamily)